MLSHSLLCGLLLATAGWIPGPVTNDALDTVEARLTQLEAEAQASSSRQLEFVLGIEQRLKPRGLKRFFSSGSQGIHVGELPFERIEAVIDAPVAVERLLKIAKRKYKRRDGAYVAPSSGQVGVEVLDALNRMQVARQRETIRSIVEKAVEARQLADSAQAMQNLGKALDALPSQPAERARFSRGLIKSFEKQPNRVSDLVAPGGWKRLVIAHYNESHPRAKVEADAMNDLDPSIVAEDGPLIQGRFPRIGSGLGLEEAHLPDLERIARLTSNAGTTDFLRSLQDLDREVAQLEQEGVKGPLSRALERWERKHFFPDTKVLPLGILPPDFFLELTAMGYQPKDVGAGIEHGEFAHRLQWNVVMRDFERNPGAWQHTPYELYTAIGTFDLNTWREDQSKYAWERGKNLWAFLFDQAGNEPRDGFRRPDFLTAFLRGKREAPSSVDLELLRAEGSSVNGLDLETVSRFVKKRYDKRIGALTEQIKPGVSDQSAAEQNYLSDYRDTKAAEGIYGTWTVREDRVLLIGDKEGPEDVARRRAMSRALFLGEEAVLQQPPRLPVSFVDHRPPGLPHPELPPMYGELKPPVAAADPGDVFADEEPVQGLQQPLGQAAGEGTGGRWAPKKKEKRRKK